MRTNLNLRPRLTLPVLLALGALGTTALAEQAPRPNVPQPQQRSAPQAPQNQRPGPAAQDFAVRYYAGDPLNGGRFLGESRAAPARDARPFADAPQGATFAVVPTPRGRLVVDLSTVGNDPRGFGGPGGPGFDGRGFDGRGGRGGHDDRGPGQGGRQDGPQGGPQGAPQAPNGAPRR